MATDWRTVRDGAVRRLTAAGVADPATDARRIIEQASGCEGADYHRGLDDTPTQRSMAYFDRMLSRREQGEPLQYVLGRWGFRTLDLMVDHRVLIPRPETEQVAQLVHDVVIGLEAPVVVDLGTGSGAIALSVAAECGDARVIGTDVSADALAVARANIAGLGSRGTGVELYEGSWFEALPAELLGAADVVVANPPYIADDEALPEEVERWEPAGALRAGPTGLEAARHIIAEATRWLVPGGTLVMELAPHQLDRASHLAADAGFGEVSVHRDLAERDRVLVARTAP